MTRRLKDPLRELSVEEYKPLQKLSRSGSEPAEHVARAKALLAVAEGCDYTDAARRSGRRSNDAVSQWVSRFNAEGLGALVRRAGQGRKASYTAREREVILAQARRAPDPKKDGTATWSLSTLQRALRRKKALSQISTYTVRAVLHEAGCRWVNNASGCETGKVLRRRKSGWVEVVDPDTDAKKKWIERAYREGEKLGLAVWTQDEAGPYQTIPYTGHGWQLHGRAARYPHEYQRNGTAKRLTLFHPASGELRAQGVRQSTNAILHPWRYRERRAALSTAAPLTKESGCASRLKQWHQWQQGLTIKITLPDRLPALRMLLVLDNLSGHKTPAFVLWLFSQGIMPLYTPLGGSWLNMAESVQRIIRQRALAGQHPQTPEQIIALLDATVVGWNHDPTPFEWGGKRQARRQRSRQRRHALGGSGACARRPVRRRPLAEKWRSNCQVTH